MAYESKADRCGGICVQLCPIFFLAALVAYSYFAYVIQMCILTISNIPQKVIYLVFFHLLLFLMFWSFYAVMSAKPSLVPPQFFLTHSELQQYEDEPTQAGKISLILEKSQSLPVHCRTANGNIRFCELCKCIKPDRAHHCSSCKRCILKMDHHCVWVNGCVCFDNYKFFVLLVAYSSLYSGFIAVTSLQYFVEFWGKLASTTVSAGDVIILSMFFIAVVVCLSLAALLVFHCGLIRINRTTMEHSYRSPIFVNGPDKYGFHHGACANFVDVFGEQKIFWFLPVLHSGGGSDGVTYARNLLSDSMNKYRSVESSTPPVKTSLRLVQPASRKSQTDSDVAEGDTSSNKTERRQSSDNGVPLITPVKQLRWM